MNSQRFYIKGRVVIWSRHRDREFHYQWMVM
jgi:hypothetical protein